MTKKKFLETLAVVLFIASVVMGITYSAGVESAECQALSAQGLSGKQIDILERSFIAGAEKDMSYSLAAIAWKESSAGRYLMNLQDPSAGVFMVSIDNAMSYAKWKDTPFNRNRMAQMLMEDFQLSAEFAMLNIQFWYDQYGENWMKIWRRYNGGYSDSEASRAYAADISRKVGIIAKCGWR